MGRLGKKSSSFLEARCPGPCLSDGQAPRHLERTPICVQTTTAGSSLGRGPPCPLLLGRTEATRAPPRLARSSPVSPFPPLLPASPAGLALSITLGGKANEVPASLSQGRTSTSLAQDPHPHGGHLVHFGRVPGSGPPALQWASPRLCPLLGSGALLVFFLPLPLSPAARVRSDPTHPRWQKRTTWGQCVCGGQPRDWLLPPSQQILRK